MWNSFNDIARVLQIARNKVIAVINELVELGVIIKINVLKKDGSYSDNHYSISNLETEHETVDVTNQTEETLQKITIPFKTLINVLNDKYLKSCQSGYPKSFYFYSGVVP